MNSSAINYFIIYLYLSSNIILHSIIRSIVSTLIFLFICAISSNLTVLKAVVLAPIAPTLKLFIPLITRHNDANLFKSLRKSSLFGFTTNFSVNEYGICICLKTLHKANFPCNACSVLITKVRHTNYYTIIITFVFFKKFRVFLTLPDGFNSTISGKTFIQTEKTVILAQENLPNMKSVCIYMNFMK